MNGEDMKYAIVYDSNSGNTAMLAEAIKEVINGAELVFYGHIKDLEECDADFYIIGSWTDRGSCSKAVGEFISKLENKKIAYFGTAGYGEDASYFDKIFSRVKELINSNNELEGAFFCQGKMPLRVREKYISLITMNPQDKNIQVSIDNFDKALTHPDANDLDNVRAWADKLI